MSPPIFITGLPRTRTAWLAAFLSMPGGIIDHERQRQFSTVREYLQSFQAPIIGDSSSLLLLIQDQVRAAFPAAKWVYVYRDADEALEAAVAACNPDLEGYISRGWPRLVAEADRLSTGNAYFVSHDCLSDPKIVQSVMDYLGLGWGQCRFELFSRLNVQVQEYETGAWEWMRDTIPAPKRIRQVDHQFESANGLTARLYQDSDFDLLAQWADGHGATADARRLPPLGVVVESDGQPVVMVFAQLAVDRPVAFIEDPVSRPGSMLVDILANFHFAIGALKAALLSLGYDALVANTSPAISRTLKNWGWAQRETGLVKLETSTAA